MFTRVHQYLREIAPFQVLTAILKVEYSEMRRKTKALLTTHRKAHALVNEECLPASVLGARESGVPYTQHCIRTISSAFSILNLRIRVAGWNSAVVLIVTPMRFLKFCLPTMPTVPAMESTIQERNFHLLDYDSPHGTVESSYQHSFSVNVGCGVFGDQLIGLYIFSQRLTGDIHANFFQNGLPALLENVPLQTLRLMY
jgi:hypothetical protein